MEHFGTILKLFDPLVGVLKAPMEFCFQKSCEKLLLVNGEDNHRARHVVM